MDLKPNYDRLSRPVLLLLLIVVILYAFVENTMTVSGNYWISEAPLIATLILTTVYWHLRREVWFWLVIAVVFTIQTALAFLFPMPVIMASSPILFAMVFFDIFLIAACIRLVGNKIVEGK